MLLNPIPNRTRLLSFYLVTGALAGFAVATGAWLAQRDSSGWMSYALVMLLSWKCAGLLPMHLAKLPYQAWNVVMQRFSRAAVGLLTRACFLSVTLPDALLDREAAFRPDSPDGVWSPVSAQRDGDALPRGAWAYTPFLALIRFSSVSAKSASRPEHTYTLY